MREIAKKKFIIIQLTYINKIQNEISIFDNAFPTKKLFIEKVALASDKSENKIYSIRRPFFDFTTYSYNPSYILCEILLSFRERREIRNC